MYKSLEVERDDLMNSIRKISAAPPPAQSGVKEEDQDEFDVSHLKLHNFQIF
jgi:hypothetical protein